MVTILIADDNPRMRAALRALLTYERDFSVVAEAGDGDTALRLAVELRPDVIVADVNMPGPNGVEIAAKLYTELPDTRVLVLSVQEDTGLTRDAKAAGATAHVSKRMMETQLVPAIRQAVARPNTPPA